MAVSFPHCSWKILTGWAAPVLALHVCSSVPAKAAETDPNKDHLYSDYSITTTQRFIWQEEEVNGWNKLEEQQLKAVVDDPLQTPENLYLAASSYTSYLLDAVRHSEARWICQRYPPKADHYEYQGNCVLADNLPLMEMVRRLEPIAEAAVKAFPARVVGANIYRVMGGQLSFAGHAHEAIRIFKKGFESLPADAENQITESKLNLATAYANPLLSKHLQRLSSQYMEEVRDWYRKLNPPTVDSVTQVRWVSFNKAIGHLFMFRDYKQALADLSVADGYQPLAIDIAIFKGYAYALNRQPAEARAELKKGDWNKSFDPARAAFLHCYHDLSLRIIGDTVSLQTCLTLKDPQLDVLLDLTETLATVSLTPQEENQMWRNFYRFFSEHIKPDFQESMAAVSSDAELQQQKAESRLKDLKLKNMSLYQDLTYALSGIAVVCAIAFFLAIRSWKNSRRHAEQMTAGKARLQNIIDNIEEGLVQIRPGFHLLPEESAHLLAITGGLDLREASFDQLLALTDLNDDTRSITRQCLEASLGEGLLAWELNAPNLPTEVKIEDREIAFYWQPLVEKDVIVAVLLVMRNVTAINHLQRVSKKAREDADRMLEYAREILSSHPRAVANFLAELPRLVQHLSFSALQSEDYTAARRIAHNIKGTARTLGLLDLQNQAHWVEDELRVGNTPELAALIQDLTALGLTYTSAMQHVLGDASNMDVRSLFDLVAHHKPDLERQLAAADLSLGNLMVDESTTLTREELQPLAEVVLHALTNAADHGFILPKRQGRAVENVRFAVFVFERGEHRVLILRDNGVGIDHDKLRAQANKNGWQPDAEQLWSDYLFVEGVTTTDAVTMTSGRGVGMSAIRNAVLKLNGRVQLLDNDAGPGSMLKVTWPSLRAVAAA